MAHARAASEPGDGPLLLHRPTLSATQIAFVYAGDLWIVGREGGDARRLTSHPGRETDPHFSPDGQLIAFTGEIEARILPIPPRNYTSLAAGKNGTLFLAESEMVPGSGFNGIMIHRFDLATRKMEKLAEGVSQWALSSDGERMLFHQGERWAITGTAEASKPDEGSLKLDDMQVRVDPRAEWRQMYREAWRTERDFFYDRACHGLDLKAAEKRFEPYLENFSCRADPSYLFAKAFGELSVGHLFIIGGDQPETKRVPVGLLGADYRIDNGRYQFAHIYRGDVWNAEQRGPLAQPGVHVKAGEYLLAVDGQELRAPDNLYQCFEGLAGQPVLLRVGPAPDGRNSREVTVVPVEDDRGLRLAAWIEENRRRVNEMSGGRVAYVYLPDTHREGYARFNREYFAPCDKEGLVIDERFNTGGAVPDHIIHFLRRPLMNYRALRLGEDWSVPVAAIFGPKAMIINQWAGPGGDNLPWLFRRAGLGPLVGKRTWGGEIGGVGGYPPLIDGGTVLAPNFAFYNPEGEWEIENHGVDPDIEVELDPQSWRAGRDPQLEKAVAVVMEALEKNPLPKPKRPACPNYHPGRGAGRRKAPGLSD